MHTDITARPKTRGTHQFALAFLQNIRGHTVHCAVRKQSDAEGPTAHLLRHDAHNTTCAEKSAHAKTHAQRSLHTPHTPQKLIMAQKLKKMYPLSVAHANTCMKKHSLV